MPPESKFEQLDIGQPDIVLPEPEIQQEQAEIKILDEHEHVVDIEAPEIKKAIREAKRDFNTFFKRHEYRFDLERPEWIEQVIAAAEKDKIFSKAQKIRELIYDKNISIYGVCYLSNKCDQNCKYCPMGQTGYRVWEKESIFSLYEERQKNLAKHIKEGEELVKQGVLRQETLDSSRKEALHFADTINKMKAETKQELERLKKQFKCLSPQEVSQEIDALRQIGHQEICLLASEELWHEAGEAVRSTQEPDEVVKYTQIALDKPGIREVILNMVSYSERAFQYVLGNLKKPEAVKLQHRVFQETYDLKTYGDYHSRSPEGGKKDFKRRYNSQIAALKAGFDEVGIGALFGLSKRPLSEIKQLQIHSREIKEKCGKEPKRCCLPLANTPEGSEVEIGYKIPGRENADKITELIYALARLAMPTISIVSSERDNPEMLKNLDQYANHTTLFVHPYPGGNINALKELKNLEQVGEKPIAQAKTWRRLPQEALRNWQERGYNILGFDVEKYRASVQEH